MVRSYWRTRSKPGIKWLLDRAGFPTLEIQSAMVAVSHLLLRHTSIISRVWSRSTRSLVKWSRWGRWKVDGGDMASCSNLHARTTVFWTSGHNGIDPFFSGWHYGIDGPGIMKEQTDRETRIIKVIYIPSQPDRAPTDPVSLLCTHDLIILPTWTPVSLLLFFFLSLLHLTTSSLLFSSSLSFALFSSILSFFNIEKTMVWRQYLLKLSARRPFSFLVREQ